MGKTLLEDGPAHKRLTLTLTEFGDARLLDIRYWYFDKKSGEYKSTRKGISLTGPKFNTIIGALVEKRDEGRRGRLVRHRYGRRRGRSATGRSPAVAL